ncbi:MAG: aminodeoxychorismate/anthranilate synthase component II [Sandaracinus sp.]
MATRTAADVAPGPRVLVIDNYDSFTFNLVQLLLSLGAAPVVRRADRITVDAALALAPDALLISPGPGRPEQAGITLEALARFAGQVPILGVCLGHQAIGLAYGGRVIGAPRLMHGRTSLLQHRGGGLFAGLPTAFRVARYHSLVLDPADVPPALEVTAWTDEGEIMGVRHRSLDVEGVQFHPESFLSEHGAALVRAFLDRCGARPAR